MNTTQTARQPQPEAAASAFRFERRADDIGVITLDVPGDAQNTLKAEFGEQFDAVMAQARAHTGLQGLILCSGKPGSFLAGADIAMFDRVRDAAEVEALSRRCQAAFQQLEDFPLPVIAAIDGACLGGGLELALACHARVCADSRDTVLGLPEVMLGLLPAAGGTQRLPRLIGIARSLDLLLSGRQLRPAQAQQLGVVDEVVPSAVLLAAAARRLAQIARERRAARSGLQQRLARARGGVAAARAEAVKLALEAHPFGRRLLFTQARKQTRARTLGNYPAPERIIDVVATGYANGLAAGYAAEARAFGELAMTEVSRQCRAIFFAQNALKKESFVGDATAAPRPLRRIGVLGAGLMGSGIALVSINKAKLDVRLKDRDAAALASGFAHLDRFYDRRVARRALSRAEADAERSRVTGAIDYRGFACCDLVVEAVFEDLKLKQQMLKDVETHCRPDTVFGSNTSSIPIADIASAAQRPENVIGLHYFSPVEKMPLLEIVATRRTAPQVIATAVALGKAQGKTVIVVRDGPGFYTTRILAPYLNEATRLLAEGVDPHDVDQALMHFGFPVGPVTLLDEVGIDVGTKVAPVLARAFGERMQAPASAATVIGAGFLGRKTGKGFYVYEGQKKGAAKPVNPELHALLGVKPGTRRAATEIAERCVWLMINEAVHCLQDGVLFEPLHGDIGAIFGLGFPPFRGGPFRYLDQVGAERAVATLERLAARHGARFAPAPLLRERARRQRRFYP